MAAGRQFVVATNREGDDTGRRLPPGGGAPNSIRSLAACDPWSGVEFEASVREASSLHLLRWFRWIRSEVTR